LTDRCAADLFAGVHGSPLEEGGTNGTFSRVNTGTATQNLAISTNPPTDTRIDFLPIGPCLTARHFPPPIALIELWLTLKKATNLSDGDNPKDCSDAISPNASEKRRVALSAKAGTRTQLECSRNASDARHCAENATAPPLSIAAYEMEACAKSPTKDFPSLPNQPEC
jgi:hypothetical protein